MTVNCPNCNQVLAPNEMRCPNCGRERPPVIQKLPTMVLSQRQPEEPEPEIEGGFSNFPPPAGQWGNAFAAPKLEPVPDAKPEEEKDPNKSPTEPAMPTFWTCTQCVSLNPASAEYCENCGALNPAQQPVQLSASKPVDKAAVTNSTPVPVAGPVQPETDDPGEKATVKVPADLIATLAAEHSAAKRHWRLVSSSATDEGVSRRGSTNEDSLFTLELKRYYENKPESFGFYIVADGMGGQAAGEVASRIAIETVAPIVLSQFGSVWMSGERLKREYVERVLRDTISLAHTRLREYNDREGRDAGTTMTACCVVEDWAVFANVGDSRTYLFRYHRPRPAVAEVDQITDPVLPVVAADFGPEGSAEDVSKKLNNGKRETEKINRDASTEPLYVQPGLKIERVTRDQSLVQELVDQGEIGIDDVYSDPRRNVILHALGAPDEGVPVDIYFRPLEENDTILLCSDGLWEMVRDNQIAEVILAYPDLQVCAQNLVALANYNGGADNVTVILVRAEK